MKRITSIHNPTVKQIVSLHTSKGRKHHNAFIAHGIRVCQTIIQAQARVLQWYCTDAMFSECLALADESLMTIVTDAVMEKISPTTTPSGICAVVACNPQPSDDALASGIVLSDIADPGNMGTLIRSCVAFGKKSVVIIGGADPYSPKVVQASAGTIAALDLFIWSWEYLLAHKRNIPLYGLVVDGGCDSASVPLQNGLLVIGNEAHGIPEQWQQSCDKLITLPMPGKAESLNAAVAGSIAMYCGWVAKRDHA